MHLPGGHHVPQSPQGGVEAGIACFEHVVGRARGQIQRPDGVARHALHSLYGSVVDEVLRPERLPLRVLLAPAPNAQELPAQIQETPVSGLAVHLRQGQLDLGMASRAERRGARSGAGRLGREGGVHMLSDP